jgi:putative GTP pyrophosphokinase
VAELLELAYRHRLPMLQDTANELDRLTRLVLEGYSHAHIDRVAFRVKSLSGFVSKVRNRVAQPPYSEPLAQVEDQIGGRVLVFFEHDIDPVSQLLERTFVRVESRFHTPERDEEFGYQSHHLVCLIPDHAKTSSWSSEPSMPETFELQVRTLFMHAWAEPQHNLGYKSSGELTPDQRRLLAWVAASAWGADRGLEDAWQDVGLPTE